MRIQNRCFKLDLEDGHHTVDILEEVIRQIRDWVQDMPDKPESCGYIMGYMSSISKNITLSAVTLPQRGDYCTRVFCKLQDSMHDFLLKRHLKKQNYYMGVWHTHPQVDPCPSSIDWADWNESVQKEKSGCDYIFYVILGTESFRVWAGNSRTGVIEEVFESPIKDGLYC